MAIINIKRTKGDSFKVDVPLESTVAEMMRKCKEKTDIEPSNQKMIYKGKILKPDEILKETGLEENHVVILIRSAKPSNPQQNVSNSANTDSQPQQPNYQQSASSAGFQPNSGNSGMFGQANMGGAFGNPELQNLLNDPAAMMQTMQNPVVQEMMRNLMSNPEMMRNMMSNNPLFQNMPQGNNTTNEQVLRLAQDPQFMQSIFGMFGNNPQQQQPNQQQPNQQQPNQQQPNQQQPNQQQPNQQQPNQQQPNQQQPSMTIPPNFMSFFSRPPAQQMASSNLSTNPRMNTAPTGATINNPTNEEIDWEKRYESELDQLKNMGFTDKERNIALLKQTNGNVSVVIDRLLQG